jgi:hypothetical protein
MEIAFMITPNTPIPDIVKNQSYAELKRIDVGMEGNWNPTVTTVWEREKGLIGFEKVIRNHPEYKPSLELYYKDGWVGVHCYRNEKDQHEFDETLALHIIRHIKSRM